jgi:hypothetical protein
VAAVARMQFLERITSVAGVQVDETDDFEVTFATSGHRTPRGTTRCVSVT